MCRVTWNTLISCYGNAGDLDGAYRSVLNSPSTSTLFS